MTSPTNLLQILNDAVNYNMEKAAEKKGIQVQELFMIFQESGWQKDDASNLPQLDVIGRKCEVVEAFENKSGTDCKQAYLVYVS